jgi:hypothetical protein
LTTLESSETLILDNGESLTIKALEAGEVAANDATFNLVVAQILSNYKIKV